VAQIGPRHRVRHDVKESATFHSLACLTSRLATIRCVTSPE
jgi:hypothetical protein